MHHRKQSGQICQYFKQASLSISFFSTSIVILFSYSPSSFIWSLNVGNTNQSYLNRLRLQNKAIRIITAQVKNVYYPSILLIRNTETAEIGLILKLLTCAYICKLLVHVNIRR